MTIYLYVKQHSKTGLKYFGRTIKEDPYKYKGSGTYWKSHTKKHGIEHIETIQLWKFEDQEEASKFALKFSIENNIVESDEWANLMLEYGMDGNSTLEARLKISEANKCKTISAETRQKMSEAAKNRAPISDQTRINIGNSSRGRKASEETKAKMASSMKGKKLHEVAKAKISQLKKGVPLSEQHKKKLSEAKMGIKRGSYRKNTNKYVVIT